MTRMAFVSLRAQSLALAILLLTGITLPAERLAADSVTSANRGYSGAKSLTTIKQKVRNEFPDVRQISVNQFETMTPSVLLDVRTDEEYAVSHINGAVLAPDLDDAIAALSNTPRDALIVAYCSVGWRSSELATKLKDAGYTNVVNLEGSIFEWANNGQPVVRNGVEVSDVHPFSTRWGRYLAPALRAKQPR